LRFFVFNLLVVILKVFSAVWNSPQWHFLMAWISMLFPVCIKILQGVVQITTPSVALPVEQKGKQ